MKGKERGIHYEHLISLERPAAVREVLANYHARPENFVGTRKARLKLMEISGEGKIKRNQTFLLNSSYSSLLIFI